MRLDRLIDTTNRQMPLGQCGTCFDEDGRFEYSYLNETRARWLFVKVAAG